jgi:hypothetical protein
MDIVDSIVDSWVGGADMVDIIVDGIGLPKSKYIDSVGPI